MPTIRRFEDLEAWKSARELCREIYSASNSGALAKDFALRDQLRRAAISVMSNIAEGFERDGSGEFVHFLSIAKGSAGEIRSHLYVALDQNYLKSDQVESVKRLAVKTGSLLSGLMRYLKSSGIRGQKYRQPGAPGDQASGFSPRETKSASKSQNKKPGTRN